MILPVVLEGRTIARTFWGKAWCTHLETYGDYANRLPRGRTYVRSGSVVHLEARSGAVEARVQGSSLYDVKVTLSPLGEGRWGQVVRECSGKVSSLVELLQGRLSEGVMNIVTHRERGLFPRPEELQFTCSCPDWASMCKQVAAVMYGIGARLDTDPQLLFRLRGVDPGELLAEVVVGGSRRAAPAGDKALAGSSLGAIFAIELDDEAPPTSAPPVAKARKAARAPAVGKARPEAPARPRGKSSATPEKGGPGGASAARATRKRTAAPVEVTLAELARVGVKVSDVQGWIASGELVVSSKRGVYLTTSAVRARLLGRSGPGRRAR